ncbi:MAG: amidinotransferase [Proteobacteria bacterium]|nr:amidinotransferase [Pseudomonadota bacterium]MBU1715992.1 amidinotransferase [Pseudomonadota bacterium]
MKKSVDQESDSSRPATYGGKGWQQRRTNLQQEIATGRLWHRCGYRSESSHLKEVVLSWPGEELAYSCAPDEMLMLARPDLAAIRNQCEKLAAFYESQGITVHLARPSAPPPPNFLFQRDLFWATPDGVVLARPAARQRAGEERFAAEALAKIGVPIVMHFRGTATFEGADALWLDKKTVLLGTGIRTNHEAARQLAAFLGELDIELLTTTIPERSQHLLGIVNFVAADLAVVHGGKVTPHLTALLAAKEIKTIVLPDDDELNFKLGMNFVTLAPGKIVMPSGAPRIKARLAAQGIEAHEIEVSEYLKAAGGPACLTGILRRE